MYTRRDWPAFSFTCSHSCECTAMPMIDDAFLTKKTSRLRGSNEGSTSAQRKILYRFTSLKKKNTSSKGGIGPPARPDFLSAPPPPAPPLLVVIIPRRSYEDYAPADRQLNTTSTYRSDKSQLLLNAAPRCICPGKVGGNPRKGVGGGGGAHPCVCFVGRESFFVAGHVVGTFDIFTRGLAE